MNATTSPTRLGPSRLAWITLSAYVGGYLCWQLLGWGGDGLQTVIGDLAFWPLHLAGCWLGVSAARSATSRQVRRAWWLFAAAMVVYLLGAILQFCDEVVTAHAQPLPLLTNVAYLSFYPVMLGSLLAFPLAGETSSVRTRTLIDCATVAIAGCAVVWFVVLGPTALQLDGSGMNELLMLAYPVGDLVVIVGLASILLRRTLRSSQPALRLLGAGALLVVVGDLILGYVTLRGSYSGGQAVDSLWLVALAIFALAADAQRVANAPRDEKLPDSRQRASWIPYVGLAVLFGLLAYSEREDPLVPGGVLVIAAIVACGLIAVRQFLAQHDLVRAHAALRRAHEELDALATTDPLTGLVNHRSMIGHLDREFERAARYRRSCAVMFIDLDHFKSLNDGFGHAVGDRVLAEFGAWAAEQLRVIDVVGRWGGEEFVVLLPELEREQAMHVAERFRAGVAERTFAGMESIYLTCSVGVACFPLDGAERNELLERADRAMYAAKRLGRNQVVAADDPAVSALRSSAPTRDDEALLGAVEALAMMVDLRDHHTGTHADEVEKLASAMAAELGCSSDEIGAVAIAARLHDVGKVGIADVILRKPGPLDADEWNVMREHSSLGASIVSRIPRLRGIARAIRAHHERWDGSGYPDGLAGADIPLAARIIAVADAYDAMINERPYRGAMSRGAALEELRRDSGSQFDRRVVEALVTVAQDPAALVSSLAPGNRR